MSCTKMLKPTIKFSSVVYVFVTFVLVIFTSELQIEAKKVTLLPLSAQKVYQLLRKNDNLDAVPEGRVVTQGIAAVAGFTLGLKKAVGATLLYDIITANITEDATNQTSTTPIYLTQEICFGSRGARSLYEAEAIAEAYSRLEEKDISSQAAVRKSQEKRVTKPKRNRRKQKGNRRRHKRPQRIKVIRPPIPETSPVTTSAAAATAATADSDSQTAHPTAANTATGSSDETDLNAGTNTDTTSSTTTSSDNDQSITCIVIQKPKQ